MIKIRTARKTDIDQILAIENEAYPKPWPQKAFEVELSKNASGANIFIVALDPDTGELAGYAMGDKITDFLGILNIAVRHDMREKGIAAMLLKELERLAFHSGLRSVTLEVRESNEKAVNLYKKTGYTVKGRREKYYDNTDDALLMWKDL